MIKFEGFTVPDKQKLNPLSMLTACCADATPLIGAADCLPASWGKR